LEMTLTFVGRCVKVIQSRRNPLRMSNSIRRGDFFRGEAFTTSASEEGDLGLCTVN
jgi:hypothetical protein